MKGAGPENHTVIATGISGAGKTALMRQVIHTLSSLGLAAIAPAMITQLECTLLIADAIGNASTRNNQDSSRMIKRIKVSRSVGHIVYP
jgi:myosin heavy subunit